MVVNVFHFWLHVLSVSTENRGEYHGEPHYITRMSSPYNSYSLSRFWEECKTDYHIPLWSFWRTVTHQYFNMNMQVYLKNTTNL